MQVTLFIPTAQALPLTTIQNASDAQIGGLELELVAVPVEGLDVRFAYGYLNTSYKDFIVDFGGGDTDISDSAKFVLAPENTISAGVGYTFPPLSFGTFYLRSDVYWQDTVWFGVLSGPPFASGQNRQDGYATMSARLELRDIVLGDYGTLALAVWGRNLTDTIYKNFGIDWSDQVGNVTSGFGKPRTYGVDLTFNF
jgi:iron complex outermembrane receptor protein